MGGGENSLIYTGPEGKLGGESRFPFSFKTDGVLKYKVIKKIYREGGGDHPLIYTGLEGKP